jgi:hypothetical protein
MTKPKFSSLSVLCLSAVALVLLVVPLRASDPVGAYAIIEKIVLEPNATEPTSAQIFGVFSFAVRRTSDGTQPWPAGSFGTANTGDVYGAVQKGYLHYSCPKGKETTCRNEWSDLKSVAGTPEVIGFGSRWAMTGRIHPITEQSTTPDVYPINVGVVRMQVKSGSYGPKAASYPDMIAALQAAARAK